MKTLLIPVELCEYVLKNKLSKPFQLYILLKSSCNGKRMISAEDKIMIAQRLFRKTAKTIQNNLSILLELNWIGYNKKSKYYFIRGFAHLQKELGQKSLTAAEFEIDRINEIQAFMAAAVIGYMLNQHKKRRWMSGLEKGSPSQGIHLSSDYDKISLSIICEKLGIALSNAHCLKKKAKLAKFITVIKHFENLNIDPRFVNKMKKTVPELRTRIRVNNGNIALQEVDEIISHIRFKKRKKKEAYKKE
ncbi:MAG: hypothetical protein IPO83_18265 [Chitinophagaceae bacterium]|nr:hypothetical protein [Chitinophagaceae bacterium]